jgi:hypothetical protein
VEHFLLSGHGLAHPAHEEPGLAVERVINVLDGLDIAIDTAADGLDPSITSEEASQLMRGLSKGAGAHRRLLALLKQRTEESTG